MLLVLLVDVWHGGLLLPRLDGLLDALRLVDRFLARLDGLGALLFGAGASVAEGTSSQAIQLDGPVFAELVIGILGLAR